VALAYLKAPEIFKSGRFFAEEGEQFYARFLGKTLLFRLLYYPDLGSFQLTTNVIVSLATAVPKVFAPYVTTYLSFAFHLLVAVQLVSFCKQNGLGNFSTILLLSAWALLPQTYEVWMTATNLQWVLGVSAALVLFMPKDWIVKRWKVLAPWLLVCGLSALRSLRPGELGAGRF
jgi:hypothetical protein